MFVFRIKAVLIASFVCAAIGYVTKDISSPTFHVRSSKGGNEINITRVRLSDEEIVEVYDEIQGVWGTVCNYRGRFHEYAAKAVCSMLGYSKPDPLILDPVNSRAHDSWPVLIRTMHNCRNEQDLNDCLLNLYPEPKCDHSNDAALRCNPLDLKDAQEGQLRIYQKGVATPPQEGYLQIYHDDEWGKICNVGVMPYEMGSYAFR